jgi:serine/threonine-protein kinase
MSPEQARGRPLDRRTDIWSFGCVLYECLAGGGAFGAETFSDTIASILTTEPDWSALPAQTPTRVRDLLERCLVKDVRERMRDAGDARLELTRARSEMSGVVPAVQTGTLPAPRRRRMLPVAAACLLGGIVLGAGLWAGFAGSREESRTEPSPVSLSITVPDDQRFQTAPVLSQDGSLILYQARKESAESPEEERPKTYIRSLQDFEPRLMEEAQAAMLFTFSPDSKWLAYWGMESRDSRTPKLFKVPIDGSAPPLVLSEWPDIWQMGLIWPEMGHLVVISGSPSSVVHIAADGTGEMAEIAMPRDQVEGRLFLRRPLPDGRHALCTVIVHGDRYQHDVAVLDTQTGRARTLIEDGDSPHWFPTGHLLFTRHDVLLAAPFDLGSLEVTGGPVAIERGLRAGSVYNGAYFDISSDGTLMYAPGGIMGARRRLAYMNHDGATEDWSTERKAISEGPVVSEDETRLAVTVVADSGFDEVWVADTERRALRRFAVEPGMDCDPCAFSPDGARLAYQCNTSDYSAIYVRNFDGTGGAERLVEHDLRGLRALRFWPDGSKLLYRKSLEGSAELHVIWLDPDARGVRKNLRLLSDIGWARLSPDGRWIFYGAKVSGSWENYLRPVADDGTLGMAQPLTIVDLHPLDWLPQTGETGPELVYQDSEHKAYAVAVNASGISRPRPLPWSIPEALRDVEDFANLRDGRYLVILKGEEEKPVREYRVVLNWADAHLR